MEDKEKGVLAAAIASIQAELNYALAERNSEECGRSRWDQLYEYSRGLEFALERLAYFG